MLRRLISSSTVFITNVCLLAYSFDSVAQTSNTHTSSSPTPSSSATLTICAGEWAPFIGKEIDNNGFVAKIIRQSFATQGYEVAFKFLPWARAYHEAKTGKCDATAIWMFDEKRTSDFYYSDPVSQEEFVFFHHTDSNFDWSEVNDLKGLTLGGGIGYSYGEELNQLIENEDVSISRVKQPQQNLLRLAIKRIDIFPEEKHIGYHVLKQQSPEIQAAITHHPTPFLTNYNYLLFPKIAAESPQLLAIFNQGLKLYNAKKSEDL